MIRHIFSNDRRIYTRHHRFTPSVLAQKDHRSDLSYADAKTVFGMAETSKKHDRELRRKEKKAAREARHNARESAGSS